MKRTPARPAALVAIMFALALCLPAGSAASTVQGSGATVFIRTIDPVGAALTDACYTIVDPSLEGCDTNRDGYIFFEDIPAGSYVVEQTVGVDGYLPVGDFPITVEPESSEQYFGVVMAPALDPQPVTVDIAISTAVDASGESAPGNCVILHGGSNEGCDENNDGQIDFMDVQAGTYLLEETRTPDGVYPVGSQWIVVDRDGLVLVPRQSGDANQTGGKADVALLTRAPDTGELLSGACYIIEDASIEGCDENGDGQVDFKDVTVGAFTVHQTAAPEGYDTIADFDINVVPLDPSQSIVVKQADEQHEDGFRNVSVVLYDTITGQDLAGGTCLEIIGVSKEGCDDNGDAQVDFLDIPVGSYPIEFTNVPEGYVPTFATNTLTIEPDDPFSQTVVNIGLTPGG